MHPAMASDGETIEKLVAKPWKITPMIKKIPTYLFGSKSVRKSMIASFVRVARESERHIRVSGRIICFYLLFFVNIRKLFIFVI